MIYDSLEAYVADREHKAYMQGLNQEPKYTPVPNGYKICDECGIHVHKVGYSVCFHCFGKTHPDLYEKHARNFRATIGGHELNNASINKGGGGGDRQDMTPDSDKQVPAPTDPGCYCFCHDNDWPHCSVCYTLHKEELINDHD